MANNVLSDANGNKGRLVSFTTGTLGGTNLENSTLMRGGRALIQENINGFTQAPFMRGSPPLINALHTAPYGLSGEFANLRDFSAGAVRQHFPRGTNRMVGVDFRDATSAELVALEAFQQSLLGPTNGVFDDANRFARFATTERQKRGRDLFFGAARCAVCHNGKALATSSGEFGTTNGANESFNTGVANLLINALDGLPTEQAFGQPANSRKFSTQGLFGVRKTAPYFHDHSKPDLTEAILFYDSTQFKQSPAALQIGAANLFDEFTVGNVGDIRAFLEALVDTPFQFTRNASLVSGCTNPAPGNMVTVTITNTGTTPLTISSNKVTGSNSMLFAAGPVLPNAGPFGTGQTRSISVTFNPAAAGTFAATLEFDATDGTNTYSAGCTLSATAQAGAPVITACASNQFINAGATCQAALPALTGSVTATTCNGPLTITQSPATGALVGLGNTVVTFTVRDASNNQSTCVANVMVRDVTPPVISACASNQTLSAGANGLVALPSLTGGVAATDCNGPLTITQNPASGVLVGAGTTVVTLSVRDAASNESTCTASVTVIGSTNPPAVAHQAYLKASNAGANDLFGYAVAVSGDTVVVGAYQESSSATGVNGNQNDNSAANAGAAYVFVRNGSNWTQQAYLKPSNTGANDWFGWSVAIAGDTLVVGARQEDSNATGINGNPGDNSAANSGAAYVFVRTGTNWTQQAYLKASNTGANDEFGVSVGVSGDTVVVGASGEDSSALGVNGNQGDNAAPDSGAAYIFVRNGTNWSQQAYVKASNTGTTDQFGWKSALAGDTLVIGAYSEDSSATGVNGNQGDNTGTNAGAAYVFVRSGTTWSQQAYLKAANAGANDEFGSSVAVAGETVVIGAIGEASNATGVNGNQTNNSAALSGAAYVFVRNGTMWSQQAYLKASNTEANDLFGNAAAVSGDTVVVGARFEDSNATGLDGNPSDNSAANSGAAYIFKRTGTNWSQQAYLKASNTGAGDFLGRSLALAGDTVVIGAPGESSSATGVNGNQFDNSAASAGAAYIITGLGGAGVPEIVVEQPAGYDLTDGAATVDFGGVLTGGTVAFDFIIRNIGNADLTGLGITITGTNASDFTLISYPTAPVAGPGGSTTFTLTFSPGTAGAKLAYLQIDSNDSNESPFDLTLTGAGLPPVRFEQQAYLKAANAGANDLFGYAVAVSGDTVVVGAYQESSSATGVNGNQNDNSAANAGAAYVFVRNGSNWTQQAYLKPSNTGANDWFGWSVAIAGDTLVVGARQEDSNATGINGNPGDNSAANSGAAYVFVRTGTNWTQQAYLKASNTGANDEFGVSVGVSGDTVVVGAWREDSNAGGVNGNQGDTNPGDFGAAYVFTRTGTNWSQQAYLKASHPGVEDFFGWRLAMGVDTVVVGAYGEDSNAAGVNGDPNDNSFSFAGAAYVFVRNGTTWNQQAYLKAANTGANDEFGGSVAVSGDTVVVGAIGESSSATGVNGNPGDNTASQAGAAYVFVRSGTNWNQQAYLKASNTETVDLFGNLVAVSGDIVVIGARFEDSNATGENGNQADNSAANAGAAYLFFRRGTNWSQQAYLKASNTGAGDLFGRSVAVSGDTVVVGAQGEASNATGVNSNQSDNSAPLAGAAYIFTGTGLRPRLVLMPDESGGYFIRFIGVPGFTYRLQRAPGVTGPWSNIDIQTAPPSGLLDLRDPSPLPGQAFYRTAQP